MDLQIERFFKHSIIYAIGNIANRIGAFLLLPLYTNFLTTDQYGILEIFYSINVIVASLLGFGLAHASLRFYFEYEDKKQSNLVISTSVIVSFVVSIFCVAIGIIWKDKISIALFDSIKYANLLYLGFAIVVLEISTQIHYAYLRAKEYSKKYVIITILSMVLQVGCNIITVGKLNMGVKGILAGNLISIFTAWSILTWITISECGIGVDFKKLKELLSYSYPMLIGIVVSAFLTNADRFILKSLGSLGSVGIYALSIKLGSIINSVFLDPFQKNFGPYRFSIMKQDNAQQVYSKITSYMLYGVIYLSLGLTIFSSDVLRLLSKHDYWGASKLLPIVCLGIAIGSLIYPFQTGILITKKTKYLLYITTASGLTALILNFILVPYLAEYGCAIAGCFASIITCIATFVISQKTYPIKYEYINWIKAIILAAILYFASLFASINLNLISFGYKCILSILFPIGLYMLKCLNDGEIRYLKKYINNYFNLIVNKKQKTNNAIL